MNISWELRFDLFRYAILAATVAGLVCPLIGTMLFVRRTSFYGIALPQFAAAGIVFGFVMLPFWETYIGLGGLTVEEAITSSHAALNYHFLWTAIFTLGGLFTLVWLGRRGGNEIGRVAAAFALANACTYLFGRISPVGKSFVGELLQGEILSVGLHEFEVLIGAYAVVAILVGLFYRDFFLISFDREYAHVLGRHTIRLELLLNALTGITVAVGTIIVGPTLLFGLLVIPPLAARAWARSLKSLLILAPVFGVVSVAGGVVTSFEFDLPLGATIVGFSLLLAIPGAFKRDKVSVV